MEQAIDRIGYLMKYSNLKSILKGWNKNVAPKVSKRVANAMRNENFFCSAKMLQTKSICNMQPAFIVNKFLWAHDRMPDLKHWFLSLY